MEAREEIPCALALRRKRGDRVIAFAYRQESLEARRAVLNELKDMLTRSCCLGR